MNWYLAVLKNYAGFSGRARRKEYWMFVLFHAIFIVALAVVGTIIGTMIPYIVYALALLIPSLAAAVRRLHDTGRSGWWILIGAVPVVGFIMLLIYMCSESKSEANQYGENPKFAPVAV